MGTKTLQGQLWSVAPQYWAKLFEPFFSPLYKKAIEHLNISEETMLLDAGCGSGLFLTMAISNGANAIGMDAAAGLLDIARQRNPYNVFLEEDLESMPFADNSFHVVTGFNSFQFAGDIEKALTEAKRVLKPGGRLVIGVWDKPEMSDATVVLKAINAHIPPAHAGTPGTFILSEDGKMEAIIEKIGMKMLRRTKVSCPFFYQQLGHGVKSFMGTAPAAIAINYTEKENVEATIARALQPFILAEDMYFLQNNFLLFMAEK